MKKEYNFKTMILIAVFTLVSTLFFLPRNVLAFQINDNQIVDTSKVWNIEFTGKVGFDSITKQGITVVDSEGTTVPVSLTLGSDNKSIKVNPPQSGYTPGESYTLTVGKSVHSQDNVSMKQDRVIHFTANFDYTVAVYSGVTLGTQIVIVTFPDNVDVSQYNVTIAGIDANVYGNSSFAATVKGNYDSDSIKNLITVTKKGGSSKSITSIDDITDSVNQNSSYSLPTTVKAYMSDGSTQNVAVTWDKQVDTTKAGTFVYSGTVSGYSNKVKLTLTVNSISTKPQAPTGVDAWALSDSKVAIQWNVEDGVDGYYVYYSDDNVTWYPWEDNNGNKKLLPWQSGYSATLSGIPAGQTIYFRVSAVKDNIESDYSNIVSVTTSTPKPQTPTGIEAWTLSDNNSIAIQWDPVSGVDGYYLYYSSDNVTWYFWDDSSGNKKLLPWKSGNSAVLYDIPSGKTIYFKVTSVKGNVESDYSDIASASIISYFPLLSDVPQPSISYDSYQEDSSGKIVSYYYSRSKVPSSFISDYDSLLVNNGFQYYTTEYLSDGTPFVLYMKNGNLVGMTIIGNNIIITGQIH